MPINAENLLDYGFSNLVDSSLLAALAQLVEQRTENPCVPGSIPGGGNTFYPPNWLSEKQLVPEA